MAAPADSAHTARAHRHLTYDPVTEGKRWHSFVRKADQDLSTPALYLGSGNFHFADELCSLLNPDWGEHDGEPTRLVGYSTVAVNQPRRVIGAFII